MRRGFVDGILAGALVGVFAGAWLITGMSKKRPMGIMKKGKMMGAKAGRMLAETRNAVGEVRGVIQKRLKH